MTYSVGAGGAGGAQATSGSAGGDTVVVHNAVAYTAKGGLGGFRGNAVNSPGGHAVLGSGGYENCSGSPGESGFYFAAPAGTFHAIGGLGGSTFGGGGRGTGSSNQAGHPALSCGGGGGGGTGNNAAYVGGDGAGGTIVVEEYL